MKELRLTLFTLFFLLSAGLTAAASAGETPSAAPAITAAQLPVGKEPLALDFSWFPNRTCAVIWRNWNLVPLETLASVLKTTPEQAADLALRLGLPEYRKPTWSQARIYVTLLRGSWHLLPYEQLLTLTGMTAAELDFHLREDDFLMVKLGNLKPHCEPVFFEEPDPQKLSAWREAVGDSYSAFHGTEVPRFAFLEELKTYREKVPAAETPSAHSRFDVNYVHSYFALFGDPLADEKAELYPDGLLEKLQAAGVTGVWLHVVLRDLAPPTEAFPEFGAGHEQRIANLKRLAARAAKFGISIFLYVNEPRAEKAAFFEKPGRAEMRGSREGDFYALCTSHPAVRKWLGDSLAYVFREIPNLGGVFTITASENFTNCASHGRKDACPVCRNRDYAEIIAEVNSVVEEGVHRSAPNAKVLVWDWGWNGHGITPEIIEKLPENVYLMSVSEWSLPITRGGIASTVGEYSLSAVGPGPRATAQWEAAKKRGLKTAAKIQLGTTWEFAAVPYLPVMNLAAEHCHRLAQTGVSALMSSWSLGGYPSPNLTLPSVFSQDPLPSVNEVLDSLAASRYAPSVTKEVRAAWTVLSDAYQQFPYHISVNYTGPQQMGPANPLYPKKTHYAATMVGIPYDDLNSWRGVYPPEIFISQMRKTSDGMLHGADLLEKTLFAVPEDRRNACAQDVRYARCAGIHFASVANQAEWIFLRDQEGMDFSDKTNRRKAEILRSEVELAQKELALVREDSTIGFESTNQYWFTPQDLVEKIVQCRMMLKEFSCYGEQK